MRMGGVGSQRASTPQKHSMPWQTKETASRKREAVSIITVN